jgi:thioester reductase-like protein
MSLHFTEGLINGYAKSKYVAEELVLFANEKLDVSAVALRYCIKVCILQME